MFSENIFSKHFRPPIFVTQICAPQYVWQVYAGVLNPVSQLRFGALLQSFGGGPLEGALRLNNALEKLYGIQPELEKPKKFKEICKFLVF